MTPVNFIYNSAFKDFISLGFPEREAEKVAAESVRLWKKGYTAIESHNKSVITGKKLYKEYKKNGR